MEEIKTLTLGELIQRVPHAQSYHEDVVLIKMSDNDPLRIRFDENEALRIDNTLSIFLIISGAMDINIDNADFHLPANTQVGLIDQHTFRNIRMRPGFKGYNVCVSRPYLEEIWRDSKRIPINAIMAHSTKPVLKLLPQETQMLCEIIERIERNLGRTSHLFSKDIVMNEFRSLFMEFGNILVQRLPNAHPQPEQPNKEEIIIRFIELLHVHCKKEHSVSFYANQLCISPEYLSKILKTFSGRTVNKWIDEALMREATIYLRNWSLTIQQISDALNFSDQSAFGKFFKKHKGLSPVEYRRQQ